MEPSNAGVEAGCQGTLRAKVEHPGTGSQRPLLVGDNAVHRAVEECCNG